MPQPDITSRLRERPETIESSEPSCRSWYFSVRSYLACGVFLSLTGLVYAQRVAHRVRSPHSNPNFLIRVQRLFRPRNHRE